MPRTRPAATTFRVRGLRPGDVGDLLTQLTGPLTGLYPGADTWLPDRLRRAAHPDTPTTRPVEAAVAVDADQHPVGLVLAQPKDHGIKISTLWVAPTHRGTGIGTALVDRLVTAFGARTLYLTADGSAAPALTGLLAPFGFTPTATLPGKYRPGAVEHVLTRRPDRDPAIRALSLTRPWGQLIGTGPKNVENRSRRTTHRGVLVLHAAKSQTILAADFTRYQLLPPPPPARSCETGYLGFAHLVAVDCHDHDCAGACSPWAMEGSWHWRVAFPTLFDQVLPGAGTLGLWTPPAEVLEAVTTHLT